jgi:hypothetical protein
VYCDTSGMGIGGVLMQDDRVIVKDRKMRPEGVNESQSKFLEGTRPISQNRPDTPLF